MGAKRKSTSGAGDGSASKKLALRDGDDAPLSAESKKVVKLVVSWMLGAYVLENAQMPNTSQSLGLRHEKQKDWQSLPNFFHEFFGTEDFHCLL